ncbi:uncharacterized protein HKW66_Vig0150440 [Vigna angularis]|uniref:Uncharacterized protein n=1 Tax=Phaseolus angularis TaxID=3914 RepID=A0A8T0JY30_PHAAN|nr:uncharacterized protein HKW66_Vig0150440 [Vigna angularis]
MHHQHRQYVINTDTPPNPTHCTDHGTNYFCRKIDVLYGQRRFVKYKAEGKTTFCLADMSGNRRNSVLQESMAGIAAFKNKTVTEHKFQNGQYLRQWVIDLNNVTRCT